MNKPFNEKIEKTDISNSLNEAKTDKKLLVPVEVYSRVSGYYRPVRQWNKGKQEEFKERQMYFYS